MTDIVTTTAKPLSDLFDNIYRYKYNPSNMQRVILEHLSDVTNAAVDIVDPTNPFVFLLEASTVNTAVAITESEINLRKQYPILAQTSSDIYLHMSDKDFINRFATPTKTRFTFLFQYTSLVNNLIEDALIDGRRITIPRNTTITVDGVTFSLQYPIDIILYDNGVLQVKYDTTTTSPLQDLTTNIIEYKLIKDASLVEWLKFDVDVYQFNIESSHYAVQSSSVFSHDIDFSDSFYYCRVYAKMGTSPVWTELNTTHTDQVYDNTVPTAVLKVVDSVMNVFIPPIYIENNLVTGSIRVDIYTTNGPMSMILSNYTIAAFETVFKAVDEDNDVTEYTNALSNVSFLTYSTETVSGGTEAITYTALRDQVIDNAFGSVSPPITNTQLVNKELKNGFTVIKNVDVITNRVFLATRNLPNPINTALYTPANLSMGTFATSLSNLTSNADVYVNDDRITLPSNLLYRNVNGQITLYPSEQISALLALTPSVRAELVNADNYLYSPFYYVLDNSLDEFEVRAYHMDAPIVDTLNFISQNASTDLQVNTAAYSIEKTNTGFKITTIVRSGAFYKALSDNYVGAQLAYIPEGEKKYAYVNGTLIGLTDDEERIFEFMIETNFDIDSDHNLVITNLQMFKDELTKTKTPLTNTFSIFYTTNSVASDYVPDAANALIGTFLLEDNSVCITRETIDITFGSSLSNLWTRCRSIAAGLEYEVYQENVPMVYTEDVYEVDPVTGSIFSLNNGELVYTLLHHKGDTVLDSEGNTVFKYQKGDVRLDSNGDPVSKTEQYTQRLIDILFIDGGYYFANDTAFTAYKKELKETINTWITDQLEDIRQELLEKTRIFYYPKQSMSTISVKLNNEQITNIEAAQSLTVTLYVSNSIYRDAAIRKELRRKTIELLNQYIQTTTVSISTITNALRTTYGDSVSTIAVKGLGGDSNYDTLSIINDNTRLSLRKKLVAQEDNTLIIEEDVDVVFVDFEE